MVLIALTQHGGRSPRARVRRAARWFIRQRAYVDRRQAEGIARCGQQELLDYIADLQENNGLNLDSLSGVEKLLGEVMEVENGLVLWDSRGRGSTQKVPVFEEKRRIK